MRLTPPTPIPSQTAAAVAHLVDDSRNIRDSIDEIVKSFFVKTHVAPARPIDLMIRFADGSDWDPGSGAGLYQYYGGVWNKL